ncbi:unnamed protein product [Tetraodon nigroviridis]|uniref:(spotted green pufferfish) hypothetical protein n=1 Tax=Tetraodon nigroviridis TaxID=99883 RepID=Q4T2B7_TETNG|nr:unnamed protein product [Tetraodon nigroviridis]
MARPSHSDHVLQQLNNQREWGFLCDCLIAIGDIYFRAHKAVLAACSSYFRMMFIRDQQGAGRLDLSNMQISAECFDLILQLMYLGRIVVGSYEFQELRASMVHLQMYYIPDSLEELRDLRSSSLTPSSSSSSSVAAAAGKMMFGVRMYEQQRPAAPEAERPSKGAAAAAGRQALPATAGRAAEEAATTGLTAAPPVLDGAGEQPCDLRKRSGGRGSALRDRPRFGRTYTCDDCGFVFSCEKLLIEHILTCTNRKAFAPPRHAEGTSPVRRRAPPPTAWTSSGCSGRARTSGPRPRPAPSWPSAVRRSADGGEPFRPLPVHPRGSHLRLWEVWPGPDQRAPAAGARRALRRSPGRGLGLGRRGRGVPAGGRRGRGRGPAGRRRAGLLRLRPALPQRGPGAGARPGLPPPGALPAGAAGGRRRGRPPPQTLLQHLRQRLLPALPPARALHRAHQGEAVQLPDLRQAVPAGAPAAPAHGHAPGRGPLRLPRLRAGNLPQARPRASHDLPPVGRRDHLPGVLPDLPWGGAAGEAHGRAPVRLRRLRGEVPPAQGYEEPLQLQTRPPAVAMPQRPRPDGTRMHLGTKNGESALFTRMHRVGAWPRRGAWSRGTAPRLVNRSSL